MLNAREENEEGADLHHEKYGVEDDEGHDEVLEGCGLHHPPQLVLVTLSLLQTTDR